jgi:hypothetical protein
MFATDLVVKTPSAAVPPVPPPLFPVTPANEVQAFQGTSYIYSDCIGAESVSGENPSNGSGFGSIQAVLSGPPLNPGGYTNAALANRPGYMFIHVTTATATNIYMGTANTALIVPHVIFPNGPVVVSNIVFFTPTVSGGLNVYSLIMGNISGYANTANTINYGVGIHYDNFTNGGNWVLRQYVNNGSTTLVNSTVPFTPLTWQKLTLIYNLVPNNIACYLTPLGTTTAQEITSGVLSPALDAGTPLLIAEAGMQVRRSTASAAVPTDPLIDYWSLSVGPTGRQW